MLVAIGYFCAGRLGLTLDSPSPLVSVFWPALGGAAAMAAAPPLPTTTTTTTTRTDASPALLPDEPGASSPAPA